MALDFTVMQERPWFSCDPSVVRHECDRKSEGRPMNETNAPTTERRGSGAKSRGSSMNTDNPFDVQQLVRRCMGRIELAERLLASYESRFPDDLFKVEACLAANDLAGLARLVHQMKGAAANISAPSLYSILSRMEQAVRDEQLDVVGDCLEEIQEVWERYLQSKIAIEQR